MAVNPAQLPVAGVPTQPSGPSPNQVTAPAQAAPAPAPSPGQITDLPALQPYLGMTGYLAANELQPQLTLPQYDDATLQAIQEKLIAQQQQPILTGGQLPHPASQLGKMQSPMSPGQFAQAVASGLWQQNVIQPVQDYINTWKKDPTMGVLETLGGIAVIGGIVGLEALTGGAATPVIFAAFAALQAPQLVQSYMDEVQHPSDQNMVKAAISTGSAVIAVGSPVKAFKSLGLARNAYETAVQTRKAISAADDAADLLVGTRRDVLGQLRTGVSLRKQLETLDLNNISALRDQLQRRGADLEKGPAADLLRHAKALEVMRKKLQDARAAGEEDAANGLVRDIRKYTKDNLKDSMLRTAYDYVMLPNVPYGHVPVTAIDGVSHELQSALDEKYRIMRGLLREMHSGNSLQAPHEAANTSIASIKEAEALDRAAGGAWDMTNRLLRLWTEMKQEAGIAKGDEEKINQALEEKDIWDSLTPEQQAYGQKLRDLSNILTLGDLRFGYISQALEGRVAHYFQGIGLGKEALSVEPPAEINAWLRRPNMSRSRLWKIAVDGETGESEFRSKTRSEIIKDLEEESELYKTTHEHRQVYGKYGPKIETARRSIRRLRAGDVEARKAEALAKYKNDYGNLAVELIQMPRKQLNKILAAKPQSKDLIRGGDAIQQMIARHVHRMHRAVYGQAMQAHANLAVTALRKIMTQPDMRFWGAEMKEPEFLSKHELPDVLPATVFEGALPSSVEDTAKQMGYFLAHPPTGRKGDLNYRPALYARGELANQIQKAAEESTAAQHQTGFINALYKVNTLTKRFIMYSPFFHGMNVAGRAIAWILSDPSMAGSAMKVLRELHKDQEGYYGLLEEFSASGGVHADRWNVSDHVSKLLRESDGESVWPGAIRAPLQALDNVHKDVFEAGLWRTVDQLQLAGYLYAKARFAARGISDVESRRLAAQYANNLGGMVNPLYMSRLWKQLKSFLWFAPSYWSTFLHSLQSVVPGQSRLSTALLQSGKGRAFAGIAAVPLRAIDNRSRIELTRAQRDWMVTYLASTAVAMDMMNVMTSGHHMWDNESGHEWDIDVTNVPGLGGTQLSPSGEVRAAYITTHPFFRQGADIGNAIGLGHDWGFAHLFSDPVWEQANAFQKTSMAAGELLDGVRRQGSTKIGNLPQVGYGAIMGEELTSRLGTGTQVKVDRPSAILSLFPSGYQLQRLWKTYQQQTGQYAPGSQQEKLAQQQWQQALQVQNWLPPALLNMTGLPSVYHMGVEKPPIDDSKYENWVAQRNQIHDRLQKYSDDVFNQGMSPLEYVRHKHDEMTKQNQLNVDTWGNNSPGATLSTAYSQLATKFGLDDPGLSDQEWFQRYDAFLPAWDQLLQSAPPSTRAAWWEHTTQQWTDADYLEWEARQLRDALAASIDGQNGNYIRAYQNAIFQRQSTMTVQEFQALELQDPYYAAYKTLLTEMGRTSALGAFVSAFSSPFSQTMVLPQGFAPEEAQALAEHTGKVVVRGEEARTLAQQARQIAGEQGVAEAGGQPAESPEFQQQSAAAIAAAQQGT